MVYMDAPEARKALISYLTHTQFTKADISGTDLKNMGYKPSKRFAEVLKEVLRACLDGEVGARDAQMAYAKQLMDSSPQ